MVGIDTLIWAYQNSGPAFLILFMTGLGYVWRYDLHPRLDDLEQTQADRRDRWEDQQLNAQERTLLLDDAHERVDDVEAAIQRLKKRVRGIEQTLAAEHGSDTMLRGGDPTRNHDESDRDVDHDRTVSGGED